VIPKASSVEIEGVEEKHQGMTLDGFEVELHGTYRFGLSKRVDKLMEQIHYQVCSFGAARGWYDKETGVDVLLPSPDADTLIIFTHYLRHFYKGGIGLRQICDWCRLLWTFRNELDVNLLQKRLEIAGLVSEWRAFAAYAIDFLGMPVEAMPLYVDRARWHRKAKLLNMFILKSGNLGHNRDMSYYGKYPFVVRKTISAFQRIGDGFSHMRIFPWDSVKFTFNSLISGLRSASRGE
jgi:hypothetical protein